VKKYRYILNGIVLGENKISDFRLIAANNIKSKYNGSVAIRVNIPDDLTLTKYSCDPYSTTNDQRTINELGYDILIWDSKKKKWEIHNQFKGTRPCDIRIC
jgi:hypothetical protein